MRRPLTLALALAALLLLVPTGEAEARRGKTVRFRALTFNIRYDFESDGRNRWHNRVEIVAQTIKDSQAHVVCIQEDKQHQVEDLQPLLPDYGFVGRGRNATGSGERCSILWDQRKFTLRENGDFWLSDTPDVPGSNTWGDRYPRKVTWALLQARKGRNKLLVLNTHFPEGDNDHLRRKGAQVIQSWLEEQLEKVADELAVVVMGDFNDGEGTSSYQVLTGSEGYSLRDAWVEASPQDPAPGTYNGFEGMQTRQRIDWILVGGPARVAQADKLEPTYEGRYPSDHYPVMADIEAR